MHTHISDCCWPLEQTNARLQLNLTAPPARDPDRNWSVVLLHLPDHRQQTGPTSGFGVEMVKQNDLRADHRKDMTKKKEDALWCIGMSGSPLLCSVACILHGDTGWNSEWMLCSQTIESLISEPSLTLGRGQVGEYSTWLSFKLSGRLSEDSEKLLLLSGEDSWVGVLQM